MTFQTDERLWYAPKTGVIGEPARFVVQKGSNTAIIYRGDKPTLAHADQIRRMAEDETNPPHEEIEQEERSRQEDDTEARMEDERDTEDNGLRKSARLTKGVPPQRLGIDE